MKPAILPHQTEGLFLTDGGLETTLVFIKGFDLPCFAAFDLLKDENGYRAIKDYYIPYLKLAVDYKTNFILETPTWRANPDWVKKVGYPSDSIREINKKAVQLISELKSEFDTVIDNIVNSGCIGPRGDGYKVDMKMSALDSESYHSEQVQVFAQASVDVITGTTINYVEEGIGIVRAANSVKLPSIISFTVETDGKLPSGMSLKQAIKELDESVSEPPIYYMINCAHPTHFVAELEKGQNETWTKRIRGIRANSSCKSHEELDNSTALDPGNPEELGEQNLELKKLLSHLNVFGGCCGTDDKHLLEIVTRLSLVSSNV